MIKYALDKITNFCFIAHTCQFASPGWSYLKHGYGAGHLTQGGSYVTFLSPDKKDATIVIETMVSRQQQPII